MNEKVPGDAVRHPDGEPVVVLRPADPTRTKTLGEIALKHQSEEALRSAVEDRPLTMLGYLVRRKGKLLAVDENGENPMEIAAGDVFAAPGDLRKPS